MKNKTQHIYPEWAIKHRKPATELRFINNTYYLYEVTAKYDPIAKKGKKVTGKLLGKIVQDRGFIPSVKKELADKAKQPVDLNKIGVREYGITAFISTRGKLIEQRLQYYFPQEYKLILYAAYCRLVHQCPIKNMPLFIAKTMLSIESEDAVYEGKISKMLQSIGQHRATINDYMKSFIVPNDYVLVDMTNMFSSSANISYVKEGYNSDMVFDSQFNLMYIYSPKLQQPIFYKLLSGNMREVTGFKNCLMESGIDSAIIVADKGFYSKENVIELQKNKFQYIIPLRRDSKLIDYQLFDAKTNDYIEYNGRFIWTHKYQKDGHTIFIYKDEKLKVQEQNDYLKRITSNMEGYSREGFNQKLHQFGTMTIVTNINDISSNDIYTTYKSRNEIEVMFDGVKNILTADRTYMQNDDTLNGWMFINHIALQWYYIIYAMLKSEHLLSKYSVQDFIKHLYELKKVYINNDWHTEPINKTTQKLIDNLKLYIP